MIALRKRLGRECGFTLLEMLIAVIVISIIIAVAVPAYLKYRNRANAGAAQANIRSAVPAIEHYNALNVGSATDSDGSSATTGYQGMTLLRLQALEAGVKGIEILSSGATTYCVRSRSGSATYYKTPATDISPAVCS